MEHNYQVNTSSGFTLIELLVVIAIIGVLSSIGVLLNVHSYFDRANDAKRRHDLGQIATAVGLYHADHNYYPPTLSFGSPLTENGAVYMAKVPQDPDCSTGSHPCYLYVTDQTNPSQPSWFVAYGKLAIPPVNGTTACDLPCTPPAPTGYDMCVYGGTVDCSALTTISPVPSSSSSTATPVPTDTPIPTNTPLPTFTPAPSPIILDATSFTSGEGVSSLSWKHKTNNADANTLLLVSVGTSQNWTAVSSVTYNGTPLQQLKAFNCLIDPIETWGSSSCREELWYLLHPQNGNYDVIVTLNKNDSAIAGATTFLNVNAATPYGAPVSNTGVGKTASVSIPTTTNQVVFDTAIVKDHVTSLTPAAGQTVLWNTITNPAIFSAGGNSFLPAVQGNTNVSWEAVFGPDNGGAVDDEEWAEIAVPLNPK